MVSHTQTAKNKNPNNSYNNTHHNHIQTMSKPKKQHTDVNKNINNILHSKAQVSNSKYPVNKQDFRNVHTFSKNNSIDSNDVGEFFGGSFVMPGDKHQTNSIEESRPRMKSTNNLVIRDFKDGYFVERNDPKPEDHRKNASSSKPISQKKNTSDDVPVLLTPAHLRCGSLPNNFIFSEKNNDSQKKRNVQSFILSQIPSDQLNAVNMLNNVAALPEDNTNNNMNLNFNGTDNSLPQSPQGTKWSAGAYANSPPPKLIPIPKF